MAAKERTAASQPDGITHQALTMALGIVAERVQRLPKDDRDDLYQLVKDLRDANDPEDRESIIVAMQEILEQAPLRLRTLEDTEREPGEGLKTWMGQVSETMRALRKRANMTHEQLAERSGLPQSHISRLENGQHSPSRATLERIAAALGVQVSTFDPSA
jgi:DNA-binding XRE family transcriptional regulator